jgi:hypothetical protein
VSGRALVDVKLVGDVTFKATHVGPDLPGKVEGLLPRSQVSTKCPKSR